MSKKKFVKFNTSNDEKYQQNKDKRKHSQTLKAIIINL